MKTPYILATCLLACTLSAQAAPQTGTQADSQPDTLTSAQQQISATDNSGRNSQHKVEKLDDQTQLLLNEYRQLRAETEQLALYNRQMAAIVYNQDKELESLARQITEIERTERGILPLMSRMLDSLEQFVALDTPFLPQERGARIALLKDLLTRADVTVSEKFRRVLEAYQVEVDYGRNIEAYRGQMDNISYDFLRVGRLALYRISNDGQHAWLWHKGQGNWLALDDGYMRDLRKALKVAQQIAAPELMVLPLPTQASLESVMTTSTNNQAEAQ
ncbi:MAG: DUF3450 domain-containing protein [Gammaproteobacteria bacterium]|nr:DUF3450 domain-containing protein [Gammaproteobacteria bacterium]